MNLSQGLSQGLFKIIYPRLELRADNPIKSSITINLLISPNPLSNLRTISIDSLEGCKGLQRVAIYQRATLYPMLDAPHNPFGWTATNSLYSSPTRESKELSIESTSGGVENFHRGGKSERRRRISSVRNELISSLVRLRAASVNISSSIISRGNKRA